MSIKPHTPGPWTVDYTEDNLRIYAGDLLIAEVNGSTEHIEIRGYVGGGLSGLYRSPTGQERCAGRRPRSRDIDRNVLAMAATAGALEPKAAERPTAHFTICPQAIEIEYPHSGIFYS
jgi:hypothetical protein